MSFREKSDWLSFASLCLLAMHMGFSVWQFAHCILFVIWIAELLRYGMRLYYYRRAV